MRDGGRRRDEGVSEFSTSNVTFESGGCRKTVGTGLEMTPTHHRKKAMFIRMTWKQFVVFDIFDAVDDIFDIFDIVDIFEIFETRVLNGRCKKCSVEILDHREGLEEGKGSNLGDMIRFSMDHFSNLIAHLLEPESMKLVLKVVELVTTT